MSFVQVSGRIGFFSLWISLISYFLSLIFYLLSFFLIDWIIYQTISIKIGIWRLCDIQIIGYDRCADWSDRHYPTNLTNSAFLGPPDFIRTSQSLEVVAFVSYIIAGFLLLIGCCQRSLALLFFASSMSMFISIIFISSTIGLFLAKGKATYSGIYSSSFWLSIVSLILATISAISLLILSFYIIPITNDRNIEKPIEFHEKSSYPIDSYLSSFSNENRLNNHFSI